MLSFTESLIRQAGACKASAVDCNWRRISNVFVLHSTRLRALFGVVSRTIAHRCHDERVHVVQIDAEWRTVPPANIVIDACRPSLVHKREAGRISIGVRGASV